MTKKNNLKGFTGPRSKSFVSIDGPIELPDLEPEEVDDFDADPLPAEDPAKLVDYRTDYRGVVDQRKPRRFRCERCYGQGVIPSNRHCAAGKTCPSCHGIGEIEQAEITQPERENGPCSSESASKRFELQNHDPAFKPRQQTPTAQEVLPGDIDYSGPVTPAAAPTPAAPTTAGKKRELPGKLASHKKKKPKAAKRKRRRQADDVPPWEQTPLRSTADKIADAKAYAADKAAQAVVDSENQRAPWD